ncbi:MAG: SAM-dependent methyltransferase [Gammaproteobacteria bacterium]|jgi:SAM-dependent methyltransferase
MIFNLTSEPEIIKLSGHTSEKKGTLFAIEDTDLGIPFKRAFYITDFNGNQALNNRGNHSHSASSQFIINIKGEVQIKVINILNFKEYNFNLDSPSKCMFLPANHHIFMNHYSEDAVMLVLCDKHFDDDEVNNYFIPEFLDGFREVAEYLNVNLKEIIDRYNALHNDCTDRMKFKHLSELEFNDKFGNSEPEISDLLEFYSNTDNYILELTEYHSTQARRFMTSEVLKRLKSYNALNVLDYGCGVGEDSIELLNGGINTTLCDISGKTFEFAKWRINKRGYSPEYAEIDLNEQYEVLGDQKFDAIMCFEVLMHVPDPSKTLTLLRSHLKKGGHLFLTHRFERNYSLALEKNKYYEKKMEIVLTELGLIFVERVPVWEGKNIYVYKT